MAYPSPGKILCFPDVRQIAATSAGPRQPAGAEGASRRPGRRVRVVRRWRRLTPWQPWPDYWIASRHGPGPRISPTGAKASGAIVVDAASLGQTNPPGALAGAAAVQRATETLPARRYWGFSDLQALQCRPPYVARGESRISTGLTAGMHYAIGSHRYALCDQTDPLSNYHSKTTGKNHWEKSRGKITGKNHGEKSRGKIAGLKAPRRPI